MGFKNLASQTGKQQLNCRKKHRKFLCSRPQTEAAIVRLDSQCTTAGAPK